MIRRLQTIAWDGRFLLRGFFDVLKWPFERAVWVLERAVIWPLGKRASRYGISLRTVAFGGLGVLAVAALAVVAIRSSGGEEAPVAAAPASAPVETAAAKPAPELAEPTLQGVAPDFTPEGGDGPAAKVADADTVIASKPSTTTDATTSSAAAASSSAADEVADPGPAAIEVARRFSDAFVLYETGNTDAEVRQAFAATATPQLAKALLQRPPRLPANVDVPKAKVLNVVPGPRQGDTFTLSASLLRVGITSELRIDVQRQDESGEWQVTDVLG